jgi:hypothetical protein
MPAAPRSVLAITSLVDGIAELSTDTVAIKDLRVDTLIDCTTTPGPNSTVVLPDIKCVPKAETVIFPLHPCAARVGVIVLIYGALTVNRFAPETVSGEVVTEMFFAPAVAVVVIVIFALQCVSSVAAVEFTIVPGPKFAFDTPAEKWDF